MLVCWEGLVAPLLPDEPHRVGMDRDRLIWIRPGLGPVYPEGEPEAAEIVFLGDSRVPNAIVPEIFDDAGLGPSAILWGGGVPTEPLVDFVSKLPASRIVACISVLGTRSVNALPDSAARVILMERPPSAEEPPKELVAWRWRRIEALNAAGYTSKPYTNLLDGFVNLMRRERTGPTWTPRTIDRYLSKHVGRFLDRKLRLLRTDGWDESWFYQADPLANDRYYLDRLPLDTEASRNVQLELTLRTLARLRAEGRDVICVRLPMDRHLLRIEEEHYRSQHLTRACERFGLPYLDYSRIPFSTRDGSHLTGPAANAFSRDLAEKLAEPASWGR